MVVIAIHHRPLRRRIPYAIVALVVALIATLAFMAGGASDVSTNSVPAAGTMVFDPSLGPNQDLPPAWGVERSPAEANRGPNADLGAGWDS